MKPQPTSAHAMRLAAGAALCGSVLLTGCATGPNAHPRDPFEPFNRGMYQFNDALDRAVLKPVATVYQTVTPDLAQRGVRNVFNNLSDAWSAINSALQGKGQEAMDNFWRFTINTTFGVGGLFDVASEAQIPRVKQDFGLTLARWGVGSGPYVVLPLLGPSTLRDTIATPVDMYGDPLGSVHDVSLRNSAVGLNVISRRADLLEASALLDAAALDPYAMMRDAYLADRDNRVGRFAREAAAAGVGDDEGYEPPLDGSGAAAAHDPDMAGYEPPPDAASGGSPAAGSAASAAAADMAGYEPPLDAAVPAASSPQPAASAAEAGAGRAAARNSPNRGATPFYTPAVPTEIIRQFNSTYSPSLWRR